MNERWKRLDIWSFVLGAVAILAFQNVMGTDRVSAETSGGGDAEHAIVAFGQNREHLALVDKAGSLRIYGMVGANLELLHVRTMEYDSQYDYFSGKGVQLPTVKDMAKGLKEKE